jgi:SAM-dependent methyltransferase
MPANDFQVEVQRDWDADSLRGVWPLTPDNRFLIQRLADAPTEAIAGNARGRLLEVAAADGQHACRLAQRGLEVFVVEPSSVMLECIRRRAKESKVSVTVVRGIGESQPFPDATFDHVLCDSALDHLADPERGIHEMARVAKPSGRVVLTFANYAGGHGTREPARIPGRARARLPPPGDREGQALLGQPGALRAQL